MNTQSIVSFSEKLHALLDKNKDLFGTEIGHLSDDLSIDKPQSLAQAFEELQSAGRLLNVGILGRVKAGKSSLLNALLFKGENVLPKAATPMTAALTTMTWGETFRADVEFYTMEDLQDIAQKAQEYQKKLFQQKEIIREEVKKRQGRLQQNKPQIDSPPARQEELLLKQAHRAMQERYPTLSAAFDQQQRIAASGVSVERLHEQKSISASTPVELGIKLQDYVGAAGTFMPFAKAVHIFMPMDDLRDMRVIDTPGLNDPVPSREHRTVELLKTCDVVFIVSPAGQFLNEQDQELMGRITTKEGVRKIILVASQIDTQLYGSEKQTRLDDALASIRQCLATRASEVLRHLKIDDPSVGSIFSDFLQSPEQNLLHSAGICHSLASRFDQRQLWDANELKAYENLSLHYPDYFSKTDSAISCASLGKLANITALKGVLQEVREQKDAIQAQKILTLIEQKSAGLQRLRQGLIDRIDDQMRRIQNENIDALKAQQKHLQKQIALLSRTVDSVYHDCQNTYIAALSDRLRKVLKNVFDETTESVEGAEKTYSETKRRKSDGLFSPFARWLGTGGYETYTESGIKINTARVYAALQEFLFDTEELLEQAVRDSWSEFDKELSKTLTPAIDSVLGNDFELEMLVSTIRDTIAMLPAPTFALGMEVPDKLKSRGTIKGGEAEQYKDMSSEFLHAVHTQTKKILSTYSQNIRKALPKEIATDFAKHLDVKISDLISQIENKTQTIDRLKRAAEAATNISL